jgi:hypothetical protein
MEPHDQRRIVREMLDSLDTTLHNGLKSVPVEWDGIELRQWMADTAQRLYAVRMEPKRRRAYNNAVIVNNL